METWCRRRREIDKKTPKIWIPHENGQWEGLSNVEPGRVSSATEGWCPEWRCGAWMRCRLVARPGGSCGATFSLSLELSLVL
eukprot:gene25155-biopygen17980